MPTKARAPITRAEAFARASQRMTGVIAGLSDEDALHVLDALGSLVARSRQQTIDALARKGA